MKNHFFRKGFTLIELLVVIGIISLLLAVFLPSLRAAKEAGQRAYCLSNLKSLGAIVQLYVSDNKGALPSGNTEGPCAWVNHAGLAYYNLSNDPVLEEQQKEAIRRGLLWPYASNEIGVYRCPTSRLGQARSYSMPDSFAYDLPQLLAVNGAQETLLIRRFSQVKNPGGRMLFLDEGWATPASWSIMYARQQWWDVVPERHASGTTFAFADGHTESWKWVDERTRRFAKEASDLENPNEATYWRRIEPGNEDIRKLVTAVWGQVGWTQEGSR